MSFLGIEPSELRKFHYKWELRKERMDSLLSDEEMAKLLLQEYKEKKELESLLEREMYLSGEIWSLTNNQSHSEELLELLKESDWNNARIEELIDYSLEMAIIPEPMRDDDDFPF